MLNLTGKIWFGLRSKNNAYSKKLSELKQIPERFGNFLELAANNWRLNGKRTLTVPDINKMLNKQDRANDIKRNQEKYFGPFARCPNWFSLTDNLILSINSSMIVHAAII